MRSAVPTQLMHEMLSLPRGATVLHLVFAASTKNALKPCRNADRQNQSTHRKQNLTTHLAGRPSAAIQQLMLYLQRVDPVMGP